MKSSARLTPFLLAAALPLLLFSWFVPQGTLQLDLVLLWLMSMILFGLPMMLLELALARRSQNLPWQGMQVLTRQADAKTTWRIFSYLSVLLSLTFAAGMVVQSATALNQIQALSHVPSYTIAFVLMVMVLILSLLKGKLLAAAVILTITSVVTDLFLIPNITIAMTDVSLKDWGIAVVLALFSVGVGTGLYWFVDDKAVSTQPIATKALPIWAVQVVFGGLALVAYSTPKPNIALWVGVLGTLIIAAFFVHYAINQLVSRFGMVKGASISIILALLLSALPVAFFSYLLLGVGLLSVLILSIFAGWVMKISHLRKSLNFKNELRYNLWRIAVRWLVPLAVVSALIGIFFNMVG